MKHQVAKNTNYRKLHTSNTSGCCSFSEMSQPKAIHFLDLPYEIYATIYKYAFLDDAKALACTCQKMNSVYGELNTHISDKILFNSERDNFNKCRRAINLKEIIIYYAPWKASYTQCIDFCLRQKHVEKIVIFGIIYSGSVSTNGNKYPPMKRLSELRLDFLTAARRDGNYILPFVKDIMTISKFTVKNSTLNQETMVALSNNVNMSYICFENVNVRQRLDFRIMLTKLRNIKTLTFLHLQFTRLLDVAATVEALVDVIPCMPNLNDLKISVWQELGVTHLINTEHYERTSNIFRLSRGNSIPFFRSMIPLVSSFRINDFELFYINENMPEANSERTLLKYKITDNETYNVKHYTYTTD